ncbi:MAG TPA: type II secretion system F family protein [Acidimicrobiia bacterium]|nr:type II secretion system F family protein [Acidimicrobiia bacterium]
MTAIRAIGVVGAGSVGVALVLAAVIGGRRARLSVRLDRYLGALGPRRSPLLTTVQRPEHALAALMRPVLGRLGRRVERLLGDDSRDLQVRLAAAGLTISSSEFRSRQVAWALAGFAGSVTLLLFLAATGHAVSVVTVLGMATAFALGAALACDRHLTQVVDRRRRAATAEFPTFVDLVCLAVTAGESLRGALELVSDSQGPLAVEVRRALLEARAGRPLTAALEERARVLGLAAFDRFVSAVIVAQERGVPLADALRAMAFDVREGEKRRVIEAGGKKQISMLMPVVGLILPVALVFAFYPGLVQIRTLAR